MITKIHIIFGSFGFLGNPESQKESKAVVVNNDVNQFYLNDIGFFDSFYDSKSADIIFIIKHFDKNIYFRDIHVFIDQIKDVIHVKNDILLR